MTPTGTHILTDIHIHLGIYYIYMYNTPLFAYIHLELPKYIDLYRQTHVNVFMHEHTLCVIIYAYPNE